VVTFSYLENVGSQFLSLRHVLRYRPSRNFTLNGNAESPYFRGFLSTLLMPRIEQR
jgi:hypothetical protein